MPSSLAEHGHLHRDADAEVAHSSGAESGQAELSSLRRPAERACRAHALNQRAAPDKPISKLRPTCACVDSAVIAAVIESFPPPVLTQLRAPAPASLVELCKSSGLAAEVTLLPVQCGRGLQRALAVRANDRQAAWGVYADLKAWELGEVCERWWCVAAAADLFE